MPTFKKVERLKSRKDIDSLHSNGKSLLVYPIKLIFEAQNKDFQSSQHKAMFAASKRRFRAAVLRNRLKRRMREAYRLNKSLLNDTTESGLKLNIAFHLIAKEEQSFEPIESAIIELLNKLSRKMSQSNG